MGTSVHIPSGLLASVDKRANELGLSRQRYIVQTLEKALKTESRWSQAFVEELAAAHSDTAGQESLDEMRRIIASSP